MSSSITPENLDYGNSYIGGGGQDDRQPLRSSRCVSFCQRQNTVLSAGAGLRNKGWKHRGLQCSVATSQSWMVTSSWSWWREKEQRLLVSSIHKKRLPFHVFSSKCLQLPISLSWAETSYWNCTPDLQQEAVQDQDSGEQQRYPMEVPRLKWGKALRLWWNEVSAVLGWIRKRMCKS